MAVCENCKKVVFKCNTYDVYEGDNKKTLCLCDDCLKEIEKKTIRIIKPKKKIGQNIFLLCFATILLLFSVIALYLINTREIFFNEAQMKDKISGVWVSPNNEILGLYGDFATWECDANGTKDELGDDISNEIQYYPWIGCLTFRGRTLYVQENYLEDKEHKIIYRSFADVLKEATAELEKQKNELEQQRQELENLDIDNLKWDSNSSYTIIKGTITNKGSRTYRFVKVKASFKDKNGDVIDTDWTYAVGNEGLEPGETKSFRLSVEKNKHIDSVSVKVIDYD